MTSVPSLEMLWEAADPSLMLTSRFGFTDAGHAANWLGEALADAWKLDLERCDRLIISDSKLLAWITVDGRDLVARCAADPALFRHLADVDTLVAWLHDEAIPVAAPIPAIDQRLRVDLDGYSVGLYPLIDGGLLDATDAGQVEAAGRTLAGLHGALAEYPRAFAGEHPLVGHQLVHGDFRSANVLQTRGRIAAILDFDEASYGSRASELAKSAVLLATRYHDWQPTSPETREAFFSAYNEVVPLEPIDRDEFDRVVSEVLGHFGWL